MTAEIVVIGKELSSPLQKNCIFNQFQSYFFNKSGCENQLFVVYLLFAVLTVL